MRNKFSLYCSIFAIAALVIGMQSCKKDKFQFSDSVTYKSDTIEVESFTPSGLNELSGEYLLVIDGATHLYFNGPIPDTLGYAVDPVNKYVTLDGQVVDTLWITKAYVPFPDTTAPGIYDVLIPIDKYNRGHVSPPLSFSLNIFNTSSNVGTLDLEGDYLRSGVPIHITKISQGNFACSNIRSGGTPNMIYVHSDNSIEIPMILIGSHISGLPTNYQADVSERHTQFYGIRYGIKNPPTVGAGDTLIYFSKRVGSAPALNRLFRQ